MSTLFHLSLHPPETNPKKAALGQLRVGLGSEECCCYGGFLYRRAHVVEHHAELPVNASC